MNNEATFSGFLADFGVSSVFSGRKAHWFNNRLFFVSEDQERLLEHMPSFGVQGAGIYAGRIKKKQFSPSLALVDALAAESDARICVDEKAGWLFICGRDLFRDSLPSHGLSKGARVFIVNKHDDVLGYGMIDEQGGVQNMLDKGDYLRREMG
ncbi:MAG: hypothetical protein ACOCWQ_03750 [Nanoarchaeota archaeon]